MTVDSLLVAVALLASISAGAVIWRARSARADPLDEWLCACVVGFAVLFGAAHVLGQIGDVTGTDLFTPVLMAAMTLGTAGTLAAFLRPSRIAYALTIEGFGRWSSLDKLALGMTVALFAGLLGLLVLNGPIGFEGFAYHLPIAAFMLQSRSLRIWDPLFMNVYPADASVLIALLLELGGERLAAIVGMIFAPIAAAAIYRLNLATGADRQLSLLFALGFCFVPLICFGAVEVASDIQGLAFALIAVSFAVLRPNTRVPWWIVAGLAGGLAFSAKSLYLVVLALAAISSFAAHILASERGGSRSQQIRDAALHMLGFGVIAAGFGSYWMIRNFVAFGNPLYPITVPMLSSLFGWPGSDYLSEIQELTTQYEWVRSSAEWFIYPWIEHHFISQNFKASSGLGPFFALVVPPAWICSSILAAQGLRDGRRSRADVLVICLMLIVAGSFVVWWLLGDRQPRYALGAVALSFPLAAACAARLDHWPRRILVGFGRSSVALSVCLFIVSFVFQNGGSFRTLSAPRPDRAEYPATLDRLPPKSVVINLFERTANFISFGSSWSNRVVAFHPLDVAPDRISHVLSVTHLRSFGDAAVYALSPYAHIPGLGECVGGELVDSVTHNPFNDVPLPIGRYLHRLYVSC